MNTVLLNFVFIKESDNLLVLYKVLYITSFFIPIEKSLQTDRLVLKKKD